MLVAVIQLPQILLRTTMASIRPLPMILLANGCVALVTSGAALLVLLIAPLGLTAVITCTALVAGLSFVGGVIADLVLWRLLPMGTGSSWPRTARWPSGGEGERSDATFGPGRPPRLPGQGRR